MATTSKEGSRRANYPIQTVRGGDENYQVVTNRLPIWNERNLRNSMSNNWRASPVPAAAVIPAPVAYFKIVALKTLVVG